MLDYQLKVVEEKQVLDRKIKELDIVNKDMSLNERVLIEHQIVSMVDYSKALEARMISWNTGSVELYKDKSGEYRYRIKSSNGNILAVASEGYKNKKDAIDSIYLAFDVLYLHFIGTSPIIVDED